MNWSTEWVLDEYSYKAEWLRYTFPVFVLNAFWVNGSYEGASVILLVHLKVTYHLHPVLSTHGSRWHSVFDNDLLPW